MKPQSSPATALRHCLGFEVQAAMAKGAPKEEKSGLSGIASSQKQTPAFNNEIMDDDIPF